MYPRVRVRVDDDDFAAEVEVENQLPLEKFKSISVESFDRCSDGNDCGTDCSQSNATVPKSYPTLRVCSEIVFPTPTRKQNQEKNGQNKPKHDQENIDESKPQIRASLVPRPRAVLSSPVNDEKIGTKSQLSQAKRPVLKKNEHGQCPLLQGKMNPKKVQSQSPVTTVRNARASATRTRPKERVTSESRTSKVTLTVTPESRTTEQGTFRGKAKNII